MAFISPFTSLIGDVCKHDNVYIASDVSVRADEGTPFILALMLVFKTV